MNKFHPGQRVQHVRECTRGTVVEQLGMWVDWRPDGYRKNEPKAAMRTDISNLRAIAKTEGGS